MREAFAMANFNQQMNGMQQGLLGQQVSAQPSLSFPYGTNTNSNFNYFNNGLNNSMNLQGQYQFLKCRPVSSKEEARAAQIDFDGSLWVFTDVGNGKIYTKQINNDGTATFKTYAFTKDENPYSSSDYVTKDEFNKVIQALMATIPSSQPQPAQEEAPPQSTDKVMLNF